MRTSIRRTIRRLPIALRRYSVATRSAPIFLAVVFLSLLVSPLAAQQIPVPGAPAGDISNLSKDVYDALNRVTLRDGGKDAQVGHKPIEEVPSCLLPPLTLVHSPTVAATALKVPGKAKKEYGEACAALKEQKTDIAEKHLRKAVHEYPKYSVAWVTLGQVLAGQQRNEEARTACSQGSSVEPTYVPAYLCVSDIAARGKAWAEVLKLSSRALELDPGTNAIAYEYNAAANLKVRNLDDAEKSGLRAVEIDKDHNEPRVHFVLAQIYEAKGDTANEATQLREYLKYANSPSDVAAVKQDLASLEERAKKGTAIDHPLADEPAGLVRSTTRRWGPADIDEAVPPVLSRATCPLPQILKETSNRTQDFLENLQRFTANELIEQSDVGKNGKKRHATTVMTNYVAQIEQNSSGYPRIEEYRSGSDGIRQTSVVDTGTAIFALIFHPSHVGNFDFRCEGLTTLRASSAWQVHFEESPDPNKSFQAIKIGGAIYLPRIKGRAWIAADGYEVLRIETDLVSAIPQIDLQREHLIISYAPVEFQKRHVRLWLPESASLYIAYHGHRYERLHNFTQFQLFSIDSAEAVKEPVAGKDDLPK